MFLCSNVSFGQDRLTPELLWELGRISDPQVSPDGKMVLYGMKKYDWRKNTGNGNLFLVPSEGGAAIQITDWEGGEWNARWRPDGKKIGFLSAKEGSSQLYEYDMASKAINQVTKVEAVLVIFPIHPSQLHFFHRGCEAGQSSSGYLS